MPVGLPAGTSGLKRHISITMKFASWTISPVSDISRYVSEGLVDQFQVLQEYFLVETLVAQVPYGYPWQPVRTLLTPIPTHLNPRRTGTSPGALS